ncbi:hypothetical protein MMC14_005064 [Varicellaria rhodocarpa]|nr:hypothetical protein [Varicellaria rhodocarpa]
MISKTAEKMNAVPGPEDTHTVWQMEEECEGLSTPRRTIKNDPLEVVVGPLTSKKRAPRAPPKPKVDVNGNVLELKKRAPAKPKGKANIKDEKITIKDEKPAIETRRLLSKTRRLPEEVDGRVVEKKEGVKRS